MNEIEMNVSGNRNNDKCKWKRMALLGHRTKQSLQVTEAPAAPIQLGRH